MIQFIGYFYRVLHALGYLYRVTWATEKKEGKKKKKKKSNVCRRPRGTFMRLWAV